MPELPEVEIVKQSLFKNINNKIIKSVRINNQNLRFKLPHNFSYVLKGSKIIFYSKKMMAICFSFAFFNNCYPFSFFIRYFFFTNTGL